MEEDEGREEGWRGKGEGEMKGDERRKEAQQ
jgi:hypothetical protein